MDKKTGTAGGQLREKPEEDFFEAVAAEGESFMAVCPWKGQIQGIKVLSYVYYMHTTLLTQGFEGKKRAFLENMKHVLGNI